jgi:hypothetical protein
MFDRWTLTSSFSGRFLVTRWFRASEEERRQVLPRSEVPWKARQLLEQSERSDLCGMYRESIGDTDFTQLSDNDLIRAVSREIEAGHLLVIPIPEMEYRGSGPTAQPLPVPSPAEESESQVYFGRILGPAGPLARWPFLLKRDGTAVDQRSLRGSSSNAYRNGAWMSGSGGEFRFENLPPADYAIEALLPSGRLVVNDEALPEGVGESGKRIATPQRQATSEDRSEEQGWFRPPRVDELGDFVWVGEAEPTQ